MNSSVHQLFRQQTIGKKKRERTRGALLDSAISVFANKGYEGTRISDITAHADVANGTFYNYYQDKDQLLHDVALGLAIEITGRINEEMSEVTHAPTRVALATAKLLRTSRKEPEWLDVLLQGAFIVPEVQSATIQYLRQDLEMGVYQGEFNVDIDLLLVNQFISLIRVAALVDPIMSDETIKSTCEAVLRLVGMSTANAKTQVTAACESLLEA